MMMRGDCKDGQVSQYLQYLPAPLQDGHFIGRFLLAFQAVLSGGVTVPASGAGRGVERLQGLAETLDGISAYFRPQDTPEDFLPWLASWVAVDLREDWSDATRRNVVASVVPLYMLRGTRRGIEQMLRLCVTEAVEISVDDGDSSVNHYHFVVSLTIRARQNPATLRQLYRKVEAAIELQKPAHTYYSLQLQYPSLVLLDRPDPELGDPPSLRETVLAAQGVYVARNTVLGSVPVDMQTGVKLPAPLLQAVSNHPPSRT